jgi:protein-L-isoaspartate O-methyltransferase
MDAKSRLCPRNSRRLHCRLLTLFILSTVIALPQTKYENKLAPYVPSPQRVVDRMLELAAVKPGEVVYDLGCGDGRVLITAARRYNARAVGIEIDEKLVQRTTDKVAELGLQDRVAVVQGDLRNADLSNADIVVLYLMTGVNEQIRPKLEKSLKPGTRVVSYSYAVPGWSPKRIDRTDEREGHSIYLYEIPAAAKK